MLARFTLYLPHTIQARMYINIFFDIELSSQVRHCAWKFKLVYGKKTFLSCPLWCFYVQFLLFLVLLKKKESDGNYDDDNKKLTLTLMCRIIIRKIYILIHEWKSFLKSSFSNSSVASNSWRQYGRKVWLWNFIYANFMSSWSLLDFIFNPN